MTVLHLPSWYPDPQQPTNGNFVARHIQLIQAFQSSVVLHAYAQPGKRTYQITESQDQGFLEIRVAYPERGGLGIPPRFIAWSMGLEHLRKKEIEIQGIHVHVADPSAIMAYWFFRTQKIPYGISEHDSAWLEESPQRPRYLWLLKKSMKKAIFHTAVSSHLANGITRLSGIPNPTVIANPVDPVFHCTDQVLRMPFILHVSNFSKVKNMAHSLPFLRRVLEACPDAKLILIGEHGPELAPFLAWAQEPEWASRVRYLGILSENDIAVWMQKAAFLFHPSLYETMGITLAEAMHSGLRLFVKDHEPMKTYAQKQAGYVMKNEQENLAKAIDWLKNPESAPTTDEYSPNTIQTQFQQLYQSVGWQ